MQFLHTTILILHVLGAAFIVGAVLFSLILLLRKPFLKANLGLEKFIGTFATTVVGVQLLTGLYLYFSEPENFKNNKLFWIKMALFILSGIVSGGAMKMKMKKIAMSANGETVDVSSATTLAWVTLLIVLAMAILGVVIAENAT